MTTVGEKYVKMYKRFIEELKLYSKAISVLSKGHLPISLLPPSKLEKILREVRIAIAKSKDKTILILQHEIGYIWNRQSKESVQNPVFVQPYT